LEKHRISVKETDFTSHFNNINLLIDLFFNINIYMKSQSPKTHEQIYMYINRYTFTCSNVLVLSSKVITYDLRLSEDNVIELFFFY
jgi:hypothetical protein